MISDITGIDYSFFEGEEFFAPEASTELLNSIENSISDILAAALALPEGKINKLGRAFVCVYPFAGNIDAWTDVDSDIATSTLTIYPQDSNEYVSEDLLAKFSVFSYASTTEFVEFEVYKDKIRRFNRVSSTPKAKEAELDPLDALLENFNRFKEQKNRENEARPVDIETGMDFTSSFSAEQIFKFVSFLRDEIPKTPNTAS